MTYSVSLAHLSDLHFGEHSRFEDKNLTDLGKECAQSITQSMLKNFQKEKPDLIVVTGDITEQAQDTEFKQAGTFFKSLRDSLAISSSCFVFIPGNHDVSREACQSYFVGNSAKRDLEYDQELEMKKLKNFNKFVGNFYGADKPIIMQLDRGAALYQYESLGLVLAALNSSEQITDTKPTGTVSKEQAQALLDALIPESYQIKIVALHHAMESDSEATEAWISYLKTQIKDGTMSERLLDKLENSVIDVKGKKWVNRIVEEQQVHMVLYGHQHKYQQKPGSERWRDQQVYCQVCAAGSFGIKPEKTFNSQPNCIHLYNFIEKNERLQLYSATLEYDPTWPNPTRVAPGCFHDIPSYYSTGAPPEYPLVHCTASAVVGDGSVYIRQQITAILEANPRFCTALATILKITDQPEIVATHLNKKDFAAVWTDLGGRLKYLQDYFYELRDVLFIMAQGVIKEDQIAPIRQNLRDTSQDTYVLKLNIKRHLLAELVIKAALESEVKVLFQNIGGSMDVVPQNMIHIPETGIDRDNRRTYVIQELSKRLLNSDTVVSEINRDSITKMLKDNLKAYLDMREPLFIVHENIDPVEFPYLVEIIVPSKDEDIPQYGVTQIGEEYLWRLIYIILERISKLPQH